MLQAIAIYILKTIIVSALLLAYYWLALRNKRFHYYNRFYLLSAAALSMMLPLLNAGSFTFSSSSETAIQLFNVINGGGEENFIPAADSFSFDWQQLLLLGACAITLLLMLQLIFRIIAIYRIKKKFPVTHTKEFDFINTDLQQAPFSFLRNIFWRNDISPEESTGRLILLHELVHVRQKHTWDKLFMQIATAIFWMNPLYRFIQKELFLIHEFIADDKAIADNNTAAFAQMLLQAHYGKFSFTPAQPFFYSPVKRRIIMLTTSKEPRFSYWRRIMALPLLACVVLLFAFRLQKENDKAVNALPAGSSFTLIVDAGHGGTDNGAVGINGTKEKDITLAISKKIKDLSAEYGIDVILTRSDDVYMTPQEKVEFANKQKADACISVHVNAKDGYSISGSSESGMEVLVSKDNKQFDKSKLFGSAVLQSLEKDFKTNNNLLEPASGIWVIKANALPAILVEFGYIDNDADFKNLTSETRIEQMARRVLEASALYANKAPFHANNLVPQHSITIADTAVPANPPLYILDGKEISESEMKKVDANKIESVNILKDKTATDKYGAKGKNGVVEITTIKNQ